MLAGLTMFALFVAEASAADLSKVERTIAKEPAYRSKPKYCLLVFGPEAKTRVWLVQDGDSLYVDRNGNGDLTEPGKKVVAEKRDGAEEGEYTFKVGEVRDGDRLHKGLHVLVMGVDHMADQDENIKAFLRKKPKGRAYYLLIDMEMPGWKGTGTNGRVQQRAFLVDVNGVLQFADKPRDAPIIHFGGPWQIMLFGRHRLTIGREIDLVLGVGTPGIGPGTTAWIDYDGVIPEKVYPTVEISYPPKHPGEPPVREVVSSSGGAEAPTCTARFGPRRRPASVRLKSPSPSTPGKKASLPHLIIKLRLSPPSPVPNRRRCPRD
jgi:hypothetical protein